MALRTRRTTDIVVGIRHSCSVTAAVFDSCLTLSPVGIACKMVRRYISETITIGRPTYYAYLDNQGSIHIIVYICQQYFVPGFHVLKILSYANLQNSSFLHINLALH